MTARTMFDKIWDSHVVHEAEGEPAVLYVDLHLVHEVTSPQAFDGPADGRTGGVRPHRPYRRDRRSPTRRPRGPVAPDHGRDRQGSSSTRSRRTAPSSALSSTTSTARARGIVHVIAPEQGIHAAGHDHSVRRQPHVDARRLRGLRAGHRHLRGRARAGDPDAPSGQAQDDGDQRRRPVARTG